MKLLSYILLFFVMQMYAQKTVNKFNAEGKRTGVWKKYYPNKKIRYQGQFENGKEVGIFKFYSIKSSKHPIAKKVYTENSNTIAVSFFSEEGVLQSKGNMIGKLREGKWIYYRSDGKTIITTEFYKQGLLEGEQKTFYKSKKLAKIQNYKKGKLHGNAKKYTEGGILLEDVNYVDGKLNGIAKYFDLKGELISTGAYQDGKKIGSWKYNYDNNRRK